MTNKTLYTIVLLAALCLLAAGSLCAREKGLPVRGDDFPEVLLTPPRDAAARAYLGLPATASFTPSQIEAELLLVELLNTHCPHCQTQTYSYNKLYELIEQSPETRGKIKMIGLAAGNFERETKDFAEIYQVRFPILPDPQFEAWKALGGTATPISLYVKLVGSGRPGVVAGLHVGLNRSYRELFDELRRLLKEDPSSIRRQPEETVPVAKPAVSPLADRELEERVRQAFVAVRGKIDKFSRLSLPSGRRVYTALSKKGTTSERLFAEVTIRNSVCDICHDVLFVYLFDASGRVIGFEPLQLTKYGNEPWTEEDVKKLKGRVVGRSLTAPRAYDPAVDAVTSATITSAIIFDSLSQGESLLQELSSQGWL